MSSTNNTEVQEELDAYVDDLSQESQEALGEVSELVDSADTAAEESIDVQDEVQSILSELEDGDAFGTARAVLRAFGSDDRTDAEEAADAAREVMGELEDVRAEGTDVVDILIDAAEYVEDEARETEIVERINQLV